MAQLCLQSNIHAEKGKIEVGDLLNDVSPNSDFDLLDVSVSSKQKDLFAEKQRQAWDCTQEARCDFSEKIRMTKRSGVYFISIWQKSLYGQTLSEIKSNDDMIDFFASRMAAVIENVIGSYLFNGGWCICTTPKRRHKERNFATLISKQIASTLGLKFYEDVACCHSRQRVGAVFSLKNLPEESNVIVYDDFVTTGQTLLGMKNLLSLENKNLVFFSGINNIL